MHRGTKIQVNKDSIEQFQSSSSQAHHKPQPALRPRRCSGDTQVTHRQDICATKGADIQTGQGATATLGVQRTREGPKLRETRTISPASGATQGLSSLINTEQKRQ